MTPSEVTRWPKCPILKQQGWQRLPLALDHSSGSQQAARWSQHRIRMGQEEEGSPRDHSTQGYGVGSYLVNRGLKTTGGTAGQSWWGSLTIGSVTWTKETFTDQTRSSDTGSCSPPSATGQKAQTACAQTVPLSLWKEARRCQHVIPREQSHEMDVPPPCHPLGAPPLHPHCQI